MNSENLRAIASRVVEQMVASNPEAASVVASLVLSEILAIGLHGGGDQSEVDEFVMGVNVRLAGIALRYGARVSWQLVPVETPHRH